MVKSDLKIDLKMHREVPEFKRCCFCLPLRRGLIGWAYAKLILNILAILFLIMEMIWLIPFAGLHYASSHIGVAAFILIDVVFTALLIIAGHKKNSKLLRISYIYSVSWLIIVPAFSVYTFINYMVLVYYMWEYYCKLYGFNTTDILGRCAFFFIVVCVQIYVVLLTRSEAIKLQSQSLEMQFVNNAAEAETRCVYTGRQCTDNKPDTSAQYTDDEHVVDTP